MISLAQLLQATTKTAATQAILDVATALGFNVTSWQSNRSGRTLIAILATIYAAFTVVAVNFAAAGGYLSTSSAGWLRLLAQELFGVSWNPASYGTGSVVLVNSSAVPYTFSPGGLTFTLGGVSFVNVYDGGALYGALPGLATLPGTGGTLTIPVQALLPGSANNTSGGVAAMSPAFLGVVATLGAVQGANDETDTALRNRCEAKRGALSPNGAQGAYAYWAQSIRLDTNGAPVYPPPVSDQAAYDVAVPLDVNRVRVSVQSSTGTVNVWLGGSGGAAIGSVVTLVDYAMSTYVLPAGITLFTGVSGGTGCNIDTINVTYTAELDPSFGVSIADAQAAIKAGLAAYFGDVQRNPIGARSKVASGQPYIYVNVLESVIVNSLPAAGLPPAIITADISIPAADVPVAVNALAVLGAVSGAPTMVTQP